jgi:hypothetical protein
VSRNVLQSTDLVRWYLTFFLNLTCVALLYCIVAAAKSVLKRIQRLSQRASNFRLQVGDASLRKNNGSSSPLTPRPAPKTPSPALSNKKRKATTSSRKSRKAQNTETSVSPGTAISAAQVIWTGTPDEKLAGGWPKGWIKKVYNRSRGPRIDRYWYSPKQQLKLRSMVEVKKFIAALVEVSGDEQAAFQIARTK